MKDKNNDENEAKIHPVLGIVLMTVVTIVLGALAAILTHAVLIGGPTAGPPMEEVTFSSSYSEQSVDFTLESEGPVRVDEIDLYIDNYAVDYDIQGDTINYVHGSEWDGEEVRLVWKHDTPDEVVLYKGTAPSQ